MLKNTPVKAVIPSLVQESVSVFSLSPSGICWRVHQHPNAYRLVVWYIAQVFLSQFAFVP
jgi:hypothetical protein